MTLIKTEERGPSLVINGCTGMSCAARAPGRWWRHGELGICTKGRTGLAELGRSKLLVQQEFGELSFPGCDPHMHCCEDPKTCIPIVCGEKSSCLDERWSVDWNCNLLLRATIPLLLCYIVTSVSRLMTTPKEKYPCHT